jgi:hypothetical protein
MKQQKIDSLLTASCGNAGRHAINVVTFEPGASTRSQTCCEGDMVAVICKDQAYVLSRG